MDTKIFNDQIHGYIKMDDLCMSIIDTPQFQRLRDLKQLGTLYYVFPGATHNRFEHSLGVSHLAGSTIERYCQIQPELNLTKREVQILSIAGLVHDIGHGPFSHVFDNEFMPLVRPNTTYSHEAMSVRMLDYLIDENNVEIENDDLEYIKNLVMGAKKSKPSNITSNAFLYEIVANGKNCIDVDKFDYLARDMQNLFGGLRRFDFSRLWHYNRVINDEICYHASVNLEIYDLFQQRYQMHKQIYTHRKGKAVEYMICDAMTLADKELKISQSTESPEDFQYMTDHIIKVIECSKSEELKGSREIIKSIRKRQLYEFIDEYLVPPNLSNKIPKVKPEDISSHNTSSGVNLRPDDIIVYDGKLNYNLKDQNPVNNVSFYKSTNIYESFKIPKHEVSLLFPEKFEERILRVYSRSKDKEKTAAIFTAFRNYIRKFSTTLPPPSPSSKIQMHYSEKEQGPSKNLFRSTRGFPLPIPEQSSKRLRTNQD